MKHKARKRFGQNFLTNQLIIKQIIQTIGLNGKEHLVEIGPGKGALTTHLINSCDHLTAIELDRDLLPLLKIELASRLHKFELINQDALRVNYSNLVSQEGQKLRLIGNLPYNISTPLLFHLLNYRDDIIDMHFMLQNEVVMRLSSPPGSKHFGRLSIMMQYYFAVEKKFFVPPEAFDPRPKVDSAIVSLTPYSDLEKHHKVKCIDDTKLELVSKLAFQQRRKTIRNNLKEVLALSDYEKLNIDPGARSETLEIVDFINIANLLSNNET